jgi:hypothetical protein
MHHHIAGRRVRIGMIDPACLSLECLALVPVYAASDGPQQGVECYEFGGQCPFMALSTRRPSHDGRRINTTN